MYRHLRTSLPHARLLKVIRLFRTHMGVNINGHLPLPLELSVHLPTLLCCKLKTIGTMRSRSLARIMLAIHDGYHFTSCLLLTPISKILHTVLHSLASTAPKPTLAGEDGRS